MSASKRRRRERELVEDLIAVSEMFTGGADEQASLGNYNEAIVQALLSTSTALQTQIALDPTSPEA